MRARECVANTILAASLAGCVATASDVVRRDDQEIRRCGEVVYVVRVVETCDLRVHGWPFMRTSWDRCRTTVTDPLGFRATTIDVGGR